LSFCLAGLNLWKPVSEIHSSIALSASAHVASCTRTARRAHQNGAERWRCRAACCSRRRRTRGAHTRCTSTTGCGGCYRSVGDIELMFRLVQAATRTNRSSCVVRFVECRCPAGRCTADCTAFASRSTMLRALRLGTQSSEASSRAWSWSNLQSAMQATQTHEGGSCSLACSSSSGWNNNRNSKEAAACGIRSR